MLIENRKTRFQNKLRLLTVGSLWLLLSTLSLPLLAAKPLQLNGIAEYSHLRTSYYIAVLYLQEPSADTARLAFDPYPAKMEVRIVTDKWRGRSFSSYISSKFSINNSETIAKTYARPESPVNSLAELAAEQPLRAGDVITIEYTAAGLTVLSLNGQPFSSENGKTLFNALLQMWIGKRPPSRQFKRDILTLADPEHTADTVKLYKLLTPLAERMGFARANAIDLPSFSSGEVSSSGVLEKSFPSDAVAGSSVDSQRQSAIVKQEKTSRQLDQVVGEAAAAAKASADVNSLAIALAAAERAATRERQQLERLQSEYQEQQQRELQFRRAIVEYKASVRQQLIKRIEYPARAYDLGQQGVVVVAVTSDREGEVVDSSVHKSSGYKALDKAARKAAKKIELEAFVEPMQQPQITTLVRVVFVQ